MCFNHFKISVQLRAHLQHLVVITYSNYLDHRYLVVKRTQFMEEIYKTIRMKSDVCSSLEDKFEFFFFFFFFFFFWFNLEAATDV